MDELNTDNINGTKINYYFICPTKLWLFSHNIHMENNSEDVKLGKYLHETTYKRENEFLIDNKINIDFIKINHENNITEIHEIKKSKKMKKAHKYQLLYYMNYLKKEKNIENIKGYLNYPNTREKEEVILTKTNEEELEKIIKKIQDIIKQEKPPIFQNKNICLKCSYYELCFI